MNSILQGPVDALHSASFLCEDRDRVWRIYIYGAGTGTGGDQGSRWRT